MDPNRAALRTPRLQVLVDGTVATGVVDARVVLTNYFGADSFQVGLVVDEDGALGGRYWAQVKKPSVEVQVSLCPGAAFTTLIVGTVDGLCLDPLNGVVRIEGRDLSAALIDTGVQEAFVNQSAEAIVGSLAARHGLTVDATSAAGLVGRRYGSGHEELALGQFSRTLTAWDVIVRLANSLDYDAYVRGRTLFFHPTSARPQTCIDLAVADTEHARLSRSLPTANSGGIGVGSWSSASLDSIVNAWPAATATSPSRGQGFVSIANLPPAEASRMAVQLNADLERQRRVVDLVLPGDLRFWPRGQLRLGGSGTAFDEKYDIFSVEHDFSPITGYRQSVRAYQALDMTAYTKAILGR